MIFIGIDAGTQGVRGIAADENGKILASAHREYENINLAPEDRIAEGWREQDPNDWWSAVRGVLEDMGNETDISRAATICVDGTSGTIAPIDREGNPIGNALMYNDARGRGGKGIPKILWLKEHGVRAYRFVHQADFIVGKLTGEYGITDWSNALKSGYDARSGSFSKEAEEAFSTEAGEDTVPKVVPVGTVIGKWNNVKVVAGASDGYMSAVATCAVSPGEWASIIGTTLVLKGVTGNYIDDPEGCVYCHRHPEGFWMPGGAGNVGARCINEWFISGDGDVSRQFDILNSQVVIGSPAEEPEYPLLVPGERFPFLDREFRGFGEHKSYPAVIEGISYVERMCFEKLEELGCDVGDTIYSTGGACRSDKWLRLRADILGKTIKVPEVTDAAIGGAMLGAAAEYYGSLSEAAAHMGHFAKIVEPDPEFIPRRGADGRKRPENDCYERKYEEFRKAVEEARRKQ